MSVDREGHSLKIPFSPSLWELSLKSSMEESKKRENPSLPMDVLPLILARLPIKDLQRLKSVCKSWLSLITSPHFANFHFSFNSHQDNRLLILSGKDCSLYSIPLNSPESPPSKFTNLQNGFHCNEIVGSCNGLLLCSCTGLSHFNLVVINPSTRQYRFIPKSQVPTNYLSSNDGFGYDCLADDYKVVRIVYFAYVYAMGTVIIGKQVMVYSLKCDSWKLVEEEVCPYDKPSYKTGALVNNKLLHWVFWYPSLKEHRIVSFDVCSEKWGVVPLPDYIDKGPIHPNNRIAWMLNGSDREDDMVDLGVLDGCLCLLTKNYARHFGEVDVWVMKEYGVQGSWMKLFDFTDLEVTGSLGVTPIAYSKDGNEILLRTFSTSRVFWYDVIDKRARSADFQGVEDYGQVSVCIQTMIPLPNTGEIGEESRKTLTEEQEHKA